MNIIKQNNFLCQWASHLAVKRASLPVSKEKNWDPLLAGAWVREFLKPWSPLWVWQKHRESTNSSLTPSLLFLSYYRLCPQGSKCYSRSHGQANTLLSCNTKHILYATCSSKSSQNLGTCREWFYFKFTPIISAAHIPADIVAKNRSFSVKKKKKL